MMKVEDFVNHILELKPKKEDFKRTDISEQLILRWISEFNIYKISDKPCDNEIMALLLNYNLKELRINDITFDSDYQQDEEYIYFGFDINDRLILNKKNGKIFSYDSFGDRIMYKCAENDEMFLDALYEIMKFWREKVTHSYSEEQTDKRSAEVAYIAALKAGGEECEDFYKSVLWVE